MGLRNFQTRNSFTRLITCFLSTWKANSVWMVTRLRPHLMNNCQKAWHYENEHSSCQTKCYFGVKKKFKDIKNSSNHRLNYGGPKRPTFFKLSKTTWNISSFCLFIDNILYSISEVCHSILFAAYLSVFIHTIIYFTLSYFFNNFWQLWASIQSWHNKSTVSVSG